MDNTITITVPADSLEAAIHGTRRWETWVVKDKPWLCLRLLSDGNVQMVNKGEDDYALTFFTPSGWHRVESPLVCPACGADMGTSKMEMPCPATRPWRVVCVCGVRGPWAATEAEARAAWGRIGRKG